MANIVASPAASGASAPVVAPASLEEIKKQLDAHAETHKSILQALQQIYDLVGARQIAPTAPPAEEAAAEEEAPVEEEAPAEEVEEQEGGARRRAHRGRVSYAARHRHPAKRHTRRRRA